MRILGVDVGETRTGLALSDPVGLTCRPLAVITEREAASRLQHVVEAAMAEGVELIVVGLPRPLAGGTNRQLESIERFVRELRSRTTIAVETWDERFTSKLAQQHRSRGRKADDVAACYLLQSYLDSRMSERP